MNANPYEPPHVRSEIPKGNRWGELGSLLANFASLGIAVPGLFMAALTPGDFRDSIAPLVVNVQYVAAGMLVPALVTSVVGLFHSPRRTANLGLFGCLVGLLLCLKLMLQS